MSVLEALILCSFVLILVLWCIVHSTSVSAGGLDLMLIRSYTCAVVYCKPRFCLFYCFVSGWFDTTGPWGSEGKPTFRTRPLFGPNRCSAEGKLHENACYICMDVGVYVSESISTLETLCYGGEHDVTHKKTILTQLEALLLGGKQWRSWQHCCIGYDVTQLNRRDTAKGFAS